MFLVLLTVLLTDVDHWECLLDDTKAPLLRFDIWWRINYDGNGRWMVEVPAVHEPIVRTRSEKKKNSPAERDKESESRVAAAEYLVSHSPPFFLSIGLYKIRGLA